ncbi:MAG: PAS domain S-box protein [Myxococcota bacterium]|nr:PAS domain S-box protein [Myxococcota bacterium]
MSQKAAEVAELERRLAEAQATIEALLSGQIDAAFDPASNTPILLSKAQDALRESEERYRRIIETTNEGVWQMDAGYKTTFMNRRMAQMLGCEADMGIGRSAMEFLDHEGRATLVTKSDDAQQVEVRFIRSDKTIMWALMEATPMFDAQGNSDGTFAMVMDITERKKSEAALQASEARLRRLWDSGIILITVSDLQGRIIEVNDAALAMLGYSRDELLANGMSWEALTPPESVAADLSAREQLETRGVTAPFEKELLRKDGTRTAILTAGALLDDKEKIVVAIDLTTRKRAERALLEVESQLRQSQKMEAVGQLAGGIAHDFNNILTVILSCGEFLLEDLQPMDPARADVEEICKAGARAAALTRQLLMFSRQQVLAPKVLEISAVTADMENMLRRVLGEDVGLVLRNSPHGGRVRVDPGSIEQVIMNLVVNARDAMPTGGQLVIETANVMLDETFVHPQSGFTPGPHVVLSVTDTGTGMDEATCARIFEPFFTTKAVGQGTGLGLSTVFGIVQQSHGTIRVHSVVGEGTTFSIYLPQVYSDAEASLATLPRTAFHGTETILLVEDEEQVRMVTRNILERHGYRVLEMRSPPEALLHVQNSSEQIDLLLTDVVMPHMSGPELARQLTKIRPQLRVLCMSGYTDDSIVRHGVLQAAIAFVQKPFTSDSLTQKVREVLDEEPTPSMKQAMKLMQDAIVRVTSDE